VLINVRDLCPILTLPDEDIYIGTKSFQVEVKNFRDFDVSKLDLIFAGDKKYNCSKIKYVDYETLDVTCDELPSKEIKMSAILVHRSNGRTFANSTNSMSIVEEPFPLLYIILIAAGGLILLALLIVLIAFIVYKRRGTSNFKFEVYRKPDFSHFRWSTYLWGNKNRVQRSQQDWDQLRELLQNPIICLQLIKQQVLLKLINILVQWFISMLAMAMPLISC